MNKIEFVFSITFRMLLLLYLLACNAIEYNMELVLVNDTMCLDGSPAGYYFSPGSDNAKWLIYHEGGGWCISLDTCLERSTTILGSTLNRSQYFHTSLLTAELSYDPNINVLMHNWNKVLLIYCDGGSFTGNNSTVYKNKTLYFKGRQNLEVIKKSLDAKGLNTSTDVVISGCSAGGQAVYLHLDWWREQISGNTKVVGLPVDGFILDRNDVYEYYNFSDNMRWVYNTMNSSTDADCMSPDCMFPEHVAQFITTPFFIMNSKYSYHSLGSIGNRVNEFGDMVAELIRHAVNESDSRGAFVDACSHHCKRYNLIIDYTNSTYAFSRFYNEGVGLYIDDRQFLCLLCCGWITELVIIVVVCAMVLGGVIIGVAVGIAVLIKRGDFPILCD